MTCLLRQRRLVTVLSCVALGAACVLAPRTTRAGELDKASQAVHGSSPSSSGSGGSSSGRSSDASVSYGSSASDEGSSSGDSGWGLIAGYLLLAPFFVPNAAVEAHFKDRWSIAPHPYADGTPGYLSHVGSAVETDGVTPRYAVAVESRKVVGAQLALDGMAPLGGPGRAQGSARLVSAYRVELDAAYAYYVDSLPSGAESAWMGKAHLAFRFAQGEHVQFRAGLGYRQWIDRGGSSLGVDGLYAFDVFWGHPMTTSVELSGGTLGNAWAFEARGTLGVVVGAGEIFAGYDAPWIGAGDGKGPTAYLGGPVAGVRVYF
jgi:hypothetical protein